MKSRRSPALGYMGPCLASNTPISISALNLSRLPFNRVHHVYLRDLMLSGLHILLKRVCLKTLLENWLIDRKMSQFGRKDNL